MTHRSTPSRAQRIGVLATVVVMHVSVFMAVLFGRSTLPVAVTRAGAMAVISVSADAAAQSRPPPSLPTRFADQSRPVSPPSAISDPDSRELAGPAGGCATVDVVAKALVADQAAVMSVINSPPETRSIAEAVVIWNAGWSNAAGSLDAPLGPVRTVVEQSLETVDDNCLDSPIAGPRLVPIPDGDQTMFLAFGSGNWTWRELVTDPAVQQSPAAADTPLRSIFDWEWL